MTSKENNENPYSASMIRVLEGLEAVRIRPGMYTGSLDKKGVYEMIEQVLESPLYAHSREQCTRIRCAYSWNSGYITLEFDYAMPTQPDQYGVPHFDTLMQRIHVGSKFHKTSYSFAVVNALSIPSELEVWVDGTLWKRKYIAGHPVSELEISKIGRSEWPQGTKLTFKPDTALFGYCELSEGHFHERFRHLAALHPGLHIEYTHSDEEPVVFYTPQGLEGLFSRGSSGPYLRIDAQKDDLCVRIVCQPHDRKDNTITSFACDRFTKGGSHIEGLQDGLLQAIQTWQDSDDVAFEDIHCLEAVIQVDMHYSNYRGQTREYLECSKTYDFIKERVIEACQKPEAKAFLSKIFWK